MRARTTTRPTPGFSLVELLVVIAVIAVLVGILLPAIGGARAAARKSATQSFISDLSNSALRFANDNADRMPGYFSPREMGDSDNEDVGFSAAENAMIDLSGPAAVLGPGSGSAPSAATAELVGPSSDSDENVYVNLATIGADDGAYFSPSGEYFKSQDPGQQFGTSAGTAFPDLIDAFGTPILVWSQDVSARGSINPDQSSQAVYEEFVARNSDSDAAWFYLASNAAFLRSESLGLRGASQASPPAGDPTSSIGWGHVTADHAAVTLASLLGSPAYPLLQEGESLKDASSDEIYPARPRGRFIAHSAGVDGIYFGTNDRGFRQNSDNNEILFGLTFKSASDERYSAEGGGFEAIDLLGDFDDQVVSGGN